MKIHIYRSELTYRTIITIVNHGDSWEMPDGEVYDRVFNGELYRDTLDADRIIMMDQDGHCDFCHEKDLA